MPEPGEISSRYLRHAEAIVTTMLDPSPEANKLTIEMANDTDFDRDLLVAACAVVAGRVLGSWAKSLGCSTDSLWQQLLAADHAKRV